MSVPKEYEFWAPSGSPWSPWVKPVLFSYMERAGFNRPAGVSWTAPRTIETGDRVLQGARNVALVVDHPDSLDMGLFLSTKGFRPIPLHNACPGPSALLDMWPAVTLLAQGARFLAEAALPDQAPPAFLLDNRRLLGTGLPQPGKFDNRWMAVPQDFPSAAFLLSREIDTVILITPGPVEEDLLHVLVPWQKAGIRIRGSESLAKEPEDLKLRMPSRLGHMAYRFLALMGLRRNSSGGFGALVPIPEPEGFGGGGGSSWGRFG